MVWARALFGPKPHLWLTPETVWAPATVWALAAGEVLADDGLVPGASKQRRGEPSLPRYYRHVWAPAGAAHLAGRQRARSSFSPWANWQSSPYVQMPRFHLCEEHARWRPKQPEHTCRLAEAGRGWPRLAESGAWRPPSGRIRAGGRVGVSALGGSPCAQLSLVGHRCRGEECGEMQARCQSSEARRCAAAQCVGWSQGAHDSARAARC